MQDAYPSDVTLIYRRIDSDGDYIMDGEKAFINNLQALAQSIKTRLRLFAGEWWEGDDSTCISLRDVLGKPRTPENKRLIELMYTARINDTIGVIEVSNVKTEFLSGRTFRYTADVRTQYGDLKLEIAE